MNYNWAFTPGLRSVTTNLILHHAAAANADPQTIHNWHLARGWAGIAYHYYVRKDGSVFSGRPENWIGGHTTDWNWCSIGICFEGNFEEEAMPASQQQAGSELIADILTRFPDILITRHMDHQATACPGKNFPFDSIVADGKTADAPETGIGASQWAEESCKKAIERGLFHGDGRGNYNWQEPLTREALCVVLDRLKLL